MKFYTAQINENFFDLHIKAEISHLSFEANCFIIECNIADCEGELWLCGNTCYPVLIFKRTVCARTQYAHDDFLKMIPDSELDDVSEFINMLLIH